ncbi:cytochrome C oxidase subunit IV family protein [Nitriliruptor alkaliphilus]|uniref:cytochrome C oxidase subunit IV family protein n=1 Tax=Nitriliruptor alkaliphilus TaxID=427918 RepID=UPI000696F015|nr:cytochrome C oxidase subunit IV family protein [Nitriliruptor alkaliphilus]
MSATETTKDTEHPSTAHHGPEPREYVRIALVLGVLTALEVSTYFVEFGRLGIPLLLVLMAIKFVMVANFFMHLKFDNRLYTRLLYSGLTLALSLYALTLVIMTFASAPTL